MKHQEPCCFLLQKQLWCIRDPYFPAEFCPLCINKVFVFSELSPGSKGEAEGEAGLILASGGLVLGLLGSLPSTTR